MPETPESHSIRLLHEMRQAIRGLGGEMCEMREKLGGKPEARTHMTMPLAQNAFNHEARTEAQAGETFREQKLSRSAASGWERWSVSLT